MAGIPNDIMEKALAIHKANSATDWLTCVGQLLTPVERIGYAILAERKRCMRIAAECEQYDYDGVTPGLGQAIMDGEDRTEYAGAIEQSFERGLFHWSEWTPYPTDKETE